MPVNRSLNRNGPLLLKDESVDLFTGLRSWTSSLVSVILIESDSALKTRIVKTVSLSRASIHSKLYYYVLKIGNADTHSIRNRRNDVSRPKFLQLSMQFTAH